MTESSDSESEIEPSIYEKRRELNAWHTVQAERLFNEAKKGIHREKLKLLEKRQGEVWSQEAADYIKKKDEILSDYHERLQYIEVTRALRTESLRRRTVGQLECAEQNLKNNKRLAYEKIESDIQARMQRLDVDTKKCSKEYTDFCREIMRNKRRERRNHGRNSLMNIIGRLLGNDIFAALESYFDIEDDIYANEQALRMLNGVNCSNNNEQDFRSHP